MSGFTSVSRRTLPGRMLQGLGVIGAWLHVPRAPAEEPGPAESGPLIVRVTRPYDAETPVREFTSYLTPNHRFFVRSHFGPPPEEAVSEAHWKLRVVRSWPLT